MQQDRRRAACTIITPDYTGHAHALRQSLFDANFVGDFYIFIVGSMSDYGSDVIPIDRVGQSDPIAAALIGQYAQDPDRSRWVMKSRAVRYLIDAGLADDVLYCDPDTFYFASPDPIFACLSEGSVVLTPHWRPIDPTLGRSFRLNFQDGLYNAGCVAANRHGLAAMDWWAQACLSACERDYANGLYDDQRYLDLMPVHFDGVRILPHKGFNLSDWNRHLRQPGPEGTRMVPDCHEVAMVHFTKRLAARIEQGDDPVLSPYYRRYCATLDQHYSGASA